MNGKYYGRLEVRYHKKEAARLEHIKNKRKRSKTMVKGYKVFNPDWTCMNKQYTCPGTFEEDVNPSVCNVGIFDEFDANFDTAGLAKDAAEAAKNGNTRREVPHGTYEVEINKLELGKSKKGDPMFSCWFKILAGEYKGSLIFMNQIVTQGFQIGIVDEFLRSLVAEMNAPILVSFQTYNQYNNLIMDIMEAIDGNYEYSLEYGENKKGFNTFKIKETYVLED